MSTLILEDWSWIAMSYQDYRKIINLPVDPQQVLIDGFTERLELFAQRFAELQIEALYKGDRCIMLKQEFSERPLSIEKCGNIFFNEYRRYVKSDNQELTIHFSHNAFEVEARVKPVEVEEEYFKFRWNSNA